MFQKTALPNCPRIASISYMEVSMFTRSATQWPADGRDTIFSSSKLTGGDNYEHKNGPVLLASPRCWRNEVPRTCEYSVRFCGISELTLSSIYVESAEIIPVPRSVPRATDAGSELMRYTNRQIRSEKTRESILGEAASHQHPAKSSTFGKRSEDTLATQFLPCLHFAYQFPRFTAVTGVQDWLWLLQSAYWPPEIQYVLDPQESYLTEQSSRLS